MNQSSSNQRHARFQSDIREIRRPNEAESGLVSLVAMPFASSPRASLRLADLALHHATENEHALGRRAAEDALLLIETLVESSKAEDRTIAAHAAQQTGEALLLLHECHRAKDAFEIAMSVFDDERDLEGAAQARFGLAKALRALHDPSVRPILEDAGELFEELGDERAVQAIELALREADAELETSPRSFHMRAAARLTA